MAYKQGSLLNPAQTLVLFDDFICNGSSGNIGWSEESGGGGGIFDNDSEVTPQHPGILEFILSTNSFATCNLYLSRNSHCFSGGPVSICFITKLSDISSSNNEYLTTLGFTDTHNFPNNGVYFTYTHTANSGNYIINASKDGTTSSINSSIPADTEWHHFKININSDGTEAIFFIDDIEVGTVTSNIPTSNPFLCGPNIDISNRGGSPSISPIMFVDLFYLKQNLSNQR